MQTEQQREAEAKFWETPELVEKLCSTLDLESTLSLAGVMNKEILKRSMTSKVWNALVRRSLDVLEYIPYDEDDDDDALDVAQKLASILKIMETPRALLMDALHVICERLPSRNPRSDQLQMICSSHDDPHSVSRWGFILLEEIEAGLQTTEQSIRSIEHGPLPGSSWLSTTMSSRLLLAIGSRLSRQKEPASSISINSSLYIVDDRRSAQAFYSIMQVNPASVKSLAVETTEREDWELVAIGMKLQPGAVKEFVTTKAALGPPVRTKSSDARRSKIKDIWDALGPGGFKIYTRKIEVLVRMIPLKNNRCENVEKSEAGWARLEQILDMSQFEFAKS